MTPSKTDRGAEGLDLKLLRLVATGEAPGLISADVSEGAARDVYVKTSPIHGLGVFARRTFATGEHVLIRDGRPVTPEEPLDTSMDESEEHCVWLESGRQVYLGFPARFINHSCEANAFVTERDDSNQVIALRPIHAHEEVLLHHGVDRSGRSPWKCHCGSERCLDILPGDFFHLPLDTQIELSPFLSAWFIHEHAAEYRAFLAEAGLDDLNEEMLN